MIQSVIGIGSREEIKMAPNSSSKASYHGTYSPIQSVIFTQNGIANLSNPQKMAILYQFTNIASRNELAKLLTNKKVDTPKKGDKNYDKKLQQAEKLKQANTDNWNKLAKTKKSTDTLRKDFLEKIPSLKNSALSSALDAVNLKKVQKAINNQVQGGGPLMEMPQIPNLQNSTVGYVLYEKLNYIDKGIVKSDDVVGQFILPPGGEIEVERKSWTKSSLEFEEAINRLAEEEQESSSSQNKELSESTSKQQQYNMGMSTTAEGGGNWGVYHFNGQGTTSISAALSLVRQTSTTEKQEMTAKAASRSRKEHKITIKRAAEFGTDVTRTEKFKNQNKFQPVSYKFFKAVKEWEIRHEVHGIALCADVMVRNPGINLRKFLEPKFNPNSVPPLNPYYPGEDIEPEPPVIITEQKVINTTADKDRLLPFMFEIPKGYILDHVIGVGNNGRITFGSDRYGHKHDDMIPGSHMGLWVDDAALRGNRVYNHRGDTRSSQVTLTAIFRRNDELKEAWGIYAREKILEIYKRNWELEQDLNLAKQRAIDEDRTTPATQILRQIERSELASGVAQFILTGNSAPEPLNDDNGEEISPALEAVMGRLISTLHHAFEWHNASYFLYPYWWDSSVFGNEMTVQDIIEIDHKDALRKAFLQASWARVLVPVMGGSERLILGFLYPGIITYIDNKLADPNYQPPMYADIVNSYVELENERKNGGLEIKENIGDPANKLSDSDVKPPDPIILSKWTEYTPTDETYAEMTLLKDNAGADVKLGEKEAVDKDDAEIKRSEAVTAIFENIKDKVRDTEITIDLSSGETAKIKSDVTQ